VPIVLWIVGTGNGLTQVTSTQAADGSQLP
jgi:hypothetical protein